MTTDDSIKFILAHDFALTLEIDGDGVTGDLLDNQDESNKFEWNKPVKLARALSGMVAKVREIRKL